MVTELKQNHLLADLSAPGFGTEATDVTAPIINLGVIARVYPHRNIAITAEYTGFKLFGVVKTVADRLTDEDLEAKMQDFDIYGTFNFGRHVGAQIGYRSLTSEYAIEEDEGDLSMKGFYFGGLVRF
jgi:2',3'-cyclic-nucleotide 2'-phosphodiesterase (5'-nucleotidase family)